MLSSGLSVPIIRLNSEEGEEQQKTSPLDILGKVTGELEEPVHGHFLEEGQKYKRKCSLDEPTSSDEDNLPTILVNAEASPQAEVGLKRRKLETNCIA